MDRRRSREFGGGLKIRGLSFVRRAEEGGGRSSGSRFLTVKEARQKLTQAELDSMITKVDTRESKQDILLLSLSLILPSFLCLLPRVFREDDVCAESFFQCPRSSSLLSAPLPARAMALVVVFFVSLAKTRRRE